MIHIVIFQHNDLLDVVLSCQPPHWLFSPMLFLSTVDSLSNPRCICHYSGASASVPHVPQSMPWPGSPLPSCSHLLQSQTLPGEYPVPSTAPQGGSWPSLRACPEQLPLVSVPGPAGWACLFGDRIVRLERILRRLCRVSRGSRKKRQPSQEGPSVWSFTIRDPAF